MQRRKDLMKKRFSPQELAEMDLQAYLASSSEEEGDVGELKALVPSDSEGSEEGFGSAEPQGDMEATFSVKASNLEEKLAERAKQGGHTLQQEPQSAWEKYLEKRKQKKRERKQKAKEDRERLKRTDAADEPQEDLGLLVDDEKERGFNLRGPQRKAHDHGLGMKELDHFKMDVNDSRISKVFNSADFEIDPTNPEFRKSEGMLEVLKEKRKRKPKAKASKVDTVKTEKVKADSSEAAGLQIFAGKRQAEAVKQPDKAIPVKRKRAK